MTDPLRILVLGGTSWLGGTVAALALERGHQVTCLARGESGSVPAGVQHVVADRRHPEAYAEVARRDWDGVLDVSWQPDLVRSALTSLAECARHWIYVSSISVYADHSTPGADESAALVDPWSGSGEVGREEYPGAKVSCETSCREALPEERLLIARAGLIVGYGDRSDRFGYWPARFARASEGDELLVPPGDTPLQVVDVKDLAAWMVHALEHRVFGTYDAIGPEVSFTELVDACVDVIGTAPTLVAPDESWLEAAEVEAWAGPDSLPLWLPSSLYDGHARRSGVAARGAGLTTRPLAESVADALTWERELGLDRPRQAGLSKDHEQSLLRRWHEQPALE